MQQTTTLAENKSEKDKIKVIMYRKFSDRYSQLSVQFSIRQKAGSKFTKNEIYLSTNSATNGKFLRETRKITKLNHDELFALLDVISRRSNNYTMTHKFFENSYTPSTFGMAKDKSGNILDKLCVSVKGTSYAFKSRYEEMVLKNFIERALQLIDMVYDNGF